MFHRDVGAPVLEREQKFVFDVVITKEEIARLKANLLYVDVPPAGTTRLTDWLCEYRETVGKRYASKLARRNAG